MVTDVGGAAVSTSKNVTASHWSLSLVEVSSSEAVSYPKKRDCHSPPFVLLRNAGKGLISLP